MINELMPLLIGAILVAFVVALVMGVIQAHKRRQAMAELAASRGWSFDVSRDRGMRSLYPHFDCLRQGSNQHAFNIIRGTSNNRPVLLFDYHYETYSRDSKGRRTTRHHYFSAVIIDTRLPLKSLLIRPEGFLDKVASFFGFEDINFELDEFSRRFYVRSPDRRWAYDVITQSTMEFLLESPTFYIELEGPHVIAFRNRQFPVEEFDQAIAVLEGVLDRIPADVVREMKEVRLS